MKAIVLLLGLIFGNQIMAQTKIVAHRGYWKTEPKTAQNSIQSLKNAQNLGVYGAEFDVHMTNDGVLVVNHDNDINKVVIAEVDYKDLKKQKLSNGEKIPTLKEYLKAGKKNKATRLIFEIKSAKSKELEDILVEKALKMVDLLNLEDQVDYISFSLNVCKTLKKLDPKTRVQYLSGDLSPREIKNLGFDGIDYHYSVFLEKNPTWIKEAKELGLVTNAWTVNSKENFDKLVAQGIDWITTDIPNELNK